jgi:hypothetical protein
MVQKAPTVPPEKSVQFHEVRDNPVGKTVALLTSPVWVVPAVVIVIILVYVCKDKSQAR